MSYSPAEITYILDQMQELFGDYPVTELNYETPFQCLLAVMLSAQTTDIQVNKVTDKLYTKIKNPADLVEIGMEDFGQAIRTVGLWKSKMRNGYKMAEMLVEKTKEQWDKKRDCLWDTVLSVGPPTPSQGATLSDIDISSLPLGGGLGGSVESPCIYTDSAHVYEEHGYYIPDTIQEMIKLPWVGTKTAKVVLYVLYRQRWVAVDTHVHRVMNRLWIVTTKYPEKTSDQLEVIIPDVYKDIAHHVVIYFGRYLCKAKKPECERCPLQEKCRWWEENVKWEM